MFKIGSNVIYKREVCKIKDIRKNSFTNLDCYVLESLSDPTLIINVPVDNKNGFISNLLTKKEVEELIDNISSIEVIDVDNKNVEIEYRNLLHSKSHTDLIKIIKTAYLRNQKRKENKRNIGQKDDEYFEKAEKYLYNELSIVLGLSYDDTKNYVIKKVVEKGDKFEQNS